MKFFTRKGFKHKFIISIICITLLNFCFTSFVHPVKADDGDIFGGKMMGIIRDFVREVADVAASLVQLGVTGEWIYAVDSKGSGIPEQEDKYWIDQPKFRYPILQISPELIFANQIEMLDVNFIGPLHQKDYALKLKDGTPLETLRKIIAGWYVTLRTIAVVGLLSVLIYIGIRIIISSTSSDRAKYKQRLVDWLVAFCLLFFMHYIMAAAVTVVDKVNEMLAGVVNVDKGIPLTKYGGVEYDTSGIYGDGTVGGDNVADHLKEEVKQRKKAIKYVEKALGGTATNIGQWEKKRLNANESRAICEITINGEVYLVYEYTKTTGTMDSSNTEYKYYYSPDRILNIGPKEEIDISTIADDEIVSDNSTVIETGASVTNKDGHNIRFKDGEQVLYFTNYARMHLNVRNEDQYLSESTAYLIIYIALVTFTAVFTIRYIKRFIYIAFLTLMAPIVALTYPLDKIKDRKSTSMEYVV